MIDLIDTRFGTNNSYTFSHGNCLPYTGVPFGMNYFAPQTTNSNGSWWFHPDDRTFQGIRLTHQPSPWIGDFSQLLFTPISGEIRYADLFHNQSSYRPEDAIFSPHYLKINSLRYGIESKFTPTEYGGHFKFDFSNGYGGLLLTNPGKASWSYDAESGLVTGYVETYSDCQDKEMKMYLALKADVSELNVLQKDELICDPNFTDQFYYVGFPNDIKEVNLQIASSFISPEQARLNLSRIQDTSFDDKKEAAKKLWEHYLKRIEIEDNRKDEIQKFYTIFYRVFLFPQKFYELDEDLEPIHYNTSSKNIEKGKYYTNNGFWDTYKTVYPLFSLIAPEVYVATIEGWLNHYKETGFLPKWLSPDERGMMPGTMIDAVLADAITKGIALDKADEILDAMIDSAKKEDPSGRYGRTATNEYQQLGYVPNHYSESVNQTQDYAYSDFCISRVAEVIGQKDIAKTFSERSLSYRNLIHPDHKLLVSKSTNNLWKEEFSPYHWGGDYTEGCAYQNSFAMYHDFLGFINQIGGPQEMHQLLNTLCNNGTTFDVNHYQFEIHEMSELAALDFGQIAISNQPSFHLPYLYHYIKQPNTARLLLKELQQHAFNNGYPGDEDNGSMSAWYVFNTLGFYPVTPGSGEYLIGIPYFDEVTLHLANGKSLRITAKNNSSHYYFVNRIERDDIAHDSLVFTHSDLIKGGTINFELCLVPPILTISDEDLPFSLTR
ncbi:alpha-1,2-mannosidase, putative [Granulicatella balaenopterae]|uniref:Alpha-1,2-mannosidase, putative n=1 Tax=Granulicatella balaenopterae TaxID=137733 RepID=A0A1H9KDG6_9LACT|nr:GH92 family glycosyl hydrolase [Granulicatella balaenopterae]SEQ97194.1 alpha-1,2-mannosidase, putative [Granulicatella balaenopterae]